MKSVFTSLLHFLRRDNSASLAPDQQGRVDMRIVLPWSDEEIGIALHCEKIKPRCSVRPLFGDMTYQTVLLGFDLESQHLLLDDFFPSLPTSQRESPFHITLSGEMGMLLLTIVIENEFRLGSAPAILAKIIDKQRLDDRRVQQRIQFQTDHAPTIKLLLPLAGQITGQMLNLSSGGLMMTSYHKDKLRFFSNLGECFINFNDTFQINAQVKIRTSQFVRKPYGHNLIRMSFSHLRDEQVDQINALIYRHVRMEATEAA